MLSVLICNINRTDFLARALRALVDDTSLKFRRTFSVVNGGDERADKVVSSFQSRGAIEVRLVKTLNKNLAASRNVGLPYCNGDIVAMTDDDAEVYPDWITRIKNAFQEHPEAGAVGGAVIGAQSEKSFVSRLADVVTFVSPLNSMYVRTLPGVNVAYRKTVLEQLGKQDESLFRGEDVDFNWRVKQLGFEVFYDPMIKVCHHHRPSLVQFMRQHYMYGRAYYLVREKSARYVLCLPA